MLNLFYNNELYKIRQNLTYNNKDVIKKNIIYLLV